MRRACAFVILLLLVVTTSGAAQLRERPAPPELRAVYLEAVESEAAIAAGLDLLDGIRAAKLPGGPAPELLTAYEGALVTLRAKHAFWPPTRLRHLNDGLALLDSAVDARPDHVEIRYLRLMSCYYLPGILGRSDSVRDDFAALARLLPAARGVYPAALYRTMVRFVAENGRLQEHELAPLLRLLDQPEG